MNKLVFEFTGEDSKVSTRVEKEFNSWMNNHEFSTLIKELRCCLLACGYGQETVDEYIPPFE